MNHIKNIKDQWGIRAERVEIKDVRLPVQLQRAYFFKSFKMLNLFNI